MATIDGIDGLRKLQGQELGTSSWREITQEQVNGFADATGDWQWIHVDVERAKDGPFKTTIAHGYLTLSLIPVISADVAQVTGIKLALNYGLNKVRFPQPVPVGSRVRGIVRNLSVDDVPGGVQAVNQVTIEMEGATKPVCVAETVVRYLA
ncbi:dehydratase [Frankia sp. CcI49]|uniref:Acyl dehydratase n=1 Tax=Parafrankia irregularis TaxID=795642 RepID=A0A0S4QU98_9ACTN|nr:MULTISPECIES: MaoC family dehydratase [Frankiaceae]KPM50511.1 dehydratase [Frankia sp. R43]MBE3204919.1 MaoC family dehydratase [Parafrankia sp. CH37]ONH58079.1 dehydratase [Frankia sp. CcI49]CUU58610.1 Acyl dehydratase [Parafrankia irregularis]